MNSIFLGYYIRRTWKNPVPRGKTMCAWPHTIYPTKKAANDDLKNHWGKLDTRFTYDIAEVWVI